MTDEQKAGRHDSAERRRAVRGGRQKGCSVFIPAEVLRAAGIDPEGELPWYRTWPGSKERRGRVIVNLYREA